MFSEIKNLKQPFHYILPAVKVSHSPVVSHQLPWDFEQIHLVLRISPPKLTREEVNGGDFDCFLWWAIPLVQNTYIQRRSRSLGNQPPGNSGWHYFPPCCGYFRSSTAVNYALGIYRVREKPARGCYLTVEWPRPNPQPVNFKSNVLIYLYSYGTVSVTVAVGDGY